MTTFNDKIIQQSVNEEVYDEPYQFYLRFIELEGMEEDDIIDKKAYILEWNNATNRVIEGLKVLHRVESQIKKWKQSIESWQEQKDSIDFDNPSTYYGYDSAKDRINKLNHAIEGTQVMIDRLSSLLTKGDERLEK